MVHSRVHYCICHYWPSLARCKMLTGKCLASLSLGSLNGYCNNSLYMYHLSSLAGWFESFKIRRGQMVHSRVHYFIWFICNKCRCVLFHEVCFNEELSLVHRGLK